MRFTVDSGLNSFYEEMLLDNAKTVELSILLLCLFFIRRNQKGNRDFLRIRSNY